MLARADSCTSIVVAVRLAFAAAALTHPLRPRVLNPSPLPHKPATYPSEPPQRPLPPQHPAMALASDDSCRPSPALRLTVRFAPVGACARAWPSSIHDPRSRRTAVIAIDNTVAVLCTYSCSNERCTTTRAVLYTRLHAFE